MKVWKVGKNILYLLQYISEEMGEADNRENGNKREGEMITSNLTREFIISAISARVWAQISFHNISFYTLLTLLSSHQ